MPNENDKEGQSLDPKELIPCERWGNPFLIDKDKQLSGLVCDNCIKLEQIKRALQLGIFKRVIEEENIMEDSIKEMTNSLTLSKGTFNKKFYLEKIKKRAETLWKSIELIEKIEDTNEEKFIDKYKELFEKLKNEYSS